MKDWKQYSVANLISDGFLFIGDGYRAKNEELAIHGIPFARVSNINDGFNLDDVDRFPEKDLYKVGNKISQYGDVVFTSKGTVGRFAFVRDNIPRFVYSPQLCYWRVLDSRVIDPRFLFFWMFGREFFLQINGVKGQTDMADYVSLVDQRNMYITLPPLHQQQSIAGILGALDDKIELNRRMNATLESMARAVFNEWFVKNEEVSNWEIVRMGDVIKVNEHGISKNYPYNHIDYIDISSVTTGHLEGTTTYSLDDAPSRARRLVKQGDTIWSTVRPNRKSYLFISNPKHNLVVSTGFAVLTPTRIPPSFLYCSVTTDEFVDYLVSNADGSAYPAVLPGRFEEAEIPLPPKEILDRFENLAGAMLTRIAHNENESRILAILRDSLLPKLMRGEVRVKKG